MNGIELQPFSRVRTRDGEVDERQRLRLWKAAAPMVNYDLRVFDVRASSDGANRDVLAYLWVGS